MMIVGPIQDRGVDQAFYLPILLLLDAGDATDSRADNFIVLALGQSLA